MGGYYSLFGFIVPSFLPFLAEMTEHYNLTRAYRSVIFALFLRNDGTSQSYAGILFRHFCPFSPE